MQVHLSTVPARIHLLFPFLSLLSLGLVRQASTDAQIKGDSGRAESPFRMKRLSFFSTRALFLLPPPPPLLQLQLRLLVLLPPPVLLLRPMRENCCEHRRVPVANDRSLLKCAVIARHKYRLYFGSFIRARCSLAADRVAGFYTRESNSFRVVSCRSTGRDAPEGKFLECAICLPRSRQLLPTSPTRLRRGRAASSNESRRRSTETSVLSATRQAGTGGISVCRFESVRG